MLGNLVAFGQVRVKIILPGKVVFKPDMAVANQAEANGMFHRFPVHHRKGTRVGQGDGADLGIGRCAEGGFIATE
jgi:hypothetical protein